MKPCPRCEDTNCELVEIPMLGNFEGVSQAVECFNCGFRAMAAADEKLAVKLWDDELVLSRLPDVAAIEKFLTNHKRGCLANTGSNCDCGLLEARAALAEVTP